MKYTKSRLSLLLPCRKLDFENFLFRVNFLDEELQKRRELENENTRLRELLELHLYLESISVIPSILLQHFEFIISIKVLQRTNSSKLLTR